MFNPNLLFAAAAVLCVLSTLTLLVKSEGVRGIGRVVGGIAWAFAGTGVIALTPGTIAFSLVLGWCFIGCGAITSALGIRKFNRRKLAQ